MDEASEDGREGLGRVAEGLRLVAFGLTASAVATVGWCVALAQFVEPGRELPAVLMDLNRRHPEVMLVLLGLNVLALVLGAAGKAFCLGVPPGSGAMPFIVMALACDAIVLVTLVVGRLASTTDAELAPVAVMAALFGYFAFVRFLRRLAEHLGSPRSAARARRILLGSGRCSSPPSSRRSPTAPAAGRR